MNKRLTAMLLVLALSLSVGMVSALADEETAPVVKDTAVEETAGGEDVAAEVSETTPAAEEVSVTAVQEATADMVLFKDLADLMRKNSPAYKALVAKIDYVEETADFVAECRTRMAQLPREIESVKIDLAEDPTNLLLMARVAELETEYATLQSMVSMYSSVAAQDTTAIEAGCDQMIMGCETMYIQLVDLELKEAALKRQIAALERTAEMMRVRQEGGQISQLQMMELENGLATAQAGLAALQAGKQSLQMQLEQMLGEKITGTFAVGTLPKVTTDQINAIDMERDLLDVLRRNPDVRAAQNADDAMWSMSQSMMSRDMWDSLSDANEYSLQGAKLAAEASFRGLYAQLLNDHKAIETAKSALELKQLSYDAVKVKYDGGAVSHYDLLTAEDDLQTAREEVIRAENTLFATYHAYNWAVKRGVLS